MHSDDYYMQMALELAAGGITSVEPNPAVGCVIVKDDKIIGRGFHEYFGGPHAEINALADCRKNGFDPAGATVYVTLEPCCHTGKTGPCTNALIDAKIARVVAAVEDPTAKVAGKGFAQLRQAGIEIVSGICETQACRLNAPFFKFAKTGRPWVIAKWAQSLDGKLARKDPNADRWISNEKSRHDCHRLRKRTQAILVGIDSVIADDPQLTVRIPDVTIDRPPLRVVLDTHLRIPLSCRIITSKDAPTLLIAGQHAIDMFQDKVIKLRNAGIEIIAVNEIVRRCDLDDVLVQLGSRGIQQLLVEGGSTVLSSFFDAHLVDEVCVYIAPLVLGDDGAAELHTTAPFGNLADIKTERFDDDIKITGLLNFPEQ